METQKNHISINGVSLYYEFIKKTLLSEGRPLLVFLHEGLGCVKQWKDFPAQLCEKVNCPAFLYDREGHGKSEMLKTMRGKDFMHLQAQIILPEIFKELNITDHKKILIGHSDGGSIAIIHAGSFPEKIKGVITEAAHVFIEDITVKGLKDAVKSYETGLLRDLLRKHHGDNTDTMFHGWADTWLREEFKEWNIEGCLKKIKAPFLAIQGQQDQYGTVAQLESIGKYAEKTQIEHIPDCGHIPHFQTREAVMEMMAKFINFAITYD
jgi:pimeloyl-ACP methyl ester carboxylesterase